MSKESTVILNIEDEVSLGNTENVDVLFEPRRETTCTHSIKENFNKKSINPTDSTPKKSSIISEENEIETNLEGSSHKLITRDDRECNLNFKTASVSTRRKKSLISLMSRKIKGN